MFKPKIVFFTLLLILLGGCSSGEDGGSLSLFGPKPTALDSSSAESVFSTFMEAWKDRDYETMYSLISPNARDAFTPEDFVDIYAEVQSILGLQDLSYQITAGPLVQGTTATIEYTVTFDTNLVGTFTEPNEVYPDAQPRMMWLISVPGEGWRVAWSRMDIFTDWTNESTLRVTRIMPRRGNIYDRNGDILVDQAGTVISIYIIENRIPDYDFCIETLARVFRREIGDIQTEFNKWAPETRFLIGELSQATINAESVTLQAACNYESVPRNTRQYYDRVAPHLIGYVGRIPGDRQGEYRAQGYRDDALVGRDGLEEAFEADLRGTIGIQLYVESAAGIPVRTIAERPAEPGTSLYLTIDRELQLGTQTLMSDAYNKGQLTWAPTSKGAAAIVMDVHTGEILAMVSYPDFDPGLFNPDTQVFNPAAEIQSYNNDPRTPLLNRATTGSYPLGSVFKVFSMITALDSGAWSPERTVSCDGTWDGTLFNDRVRTDWFPPPGHGPLDMQDGLINSCNPYFWQMSTALFDLNPDLQPDYSRLMGFGVQPPLQGVSTSAGFIPSPEWKVQQQGVPWGYGDAANLVIGQGDMTVNPLQVVRATAMVANGGTLYEPRIVQRVSLIGEEPTRVFEPVGRDLELDPEVLRLTQEAMCQVTLLPNNGRTGGTANFIFQQWYEENGYLVIVCGKTGTAQSGQARPHAWFTAYAPQENPQIAVTVIVENSCEGSEVAAPITRRIMELYFPGLRQNFGWPPLWQSGCTEIGPDSTG